MDEEQVEIEVVWQEGLEEEWDEDLENAKSFWDDDEDEDDDEEHSPLSDAPKREFTGLSWAARFNSHKRPISRYSHPHKYDCPTCGAPLPAEDAVCVPCKRRGWYMPASRPVQWERPTAKEREKDPDDRGYVKRNPKKESRQKRPRRGC